MIKLFKIILSTSILIAFASHAETSSDDMLKQIQERAAKVKQFKELLNNPDQTIRVSALDVMLKSNDQVMRELAFNQGFSSADAAMNAIALKNKINYMQQLNFTLKLTDNPTEEEKKSITEYYSNKYSIQISEYDLNTGSFTFRAGKGQVSGAQVSTQYSAGTRCSSNSRLSDSALLKGTLKCSNGNYLMELQLQ